jgi:hypothetical protein
MSEWRGRVDELETVVGEREVAKGRRGCAERVEGRADVVDEPRERELGGARAAPDRLLRLADEDGPARPRERDGGREPVRPGPDDDGVVVAQRADGRYFTRDVRL